MTWNTSSETNSERFDIEHSINGKEWTKIGSIAAHGESSTTKFYSFRDNSPISGDNFYRLKMMDSDGTFAYSHIENLHFDNSIKVYPNPVISDKLHLDTPEKVSQVQIYDLSGNVFYSGKTENGMISTSHLAAGIYIVQITATNGAVSTHRIIKSKLAFRSQHLLTVKFTSL
ncbi:T9SS type A sorting domain-containing protein [Paucibacter sp. O1-1]|nr:T9SS type A sorting domain-containing protein [Paucibacter sp. O1-1]MDA3830759.1 T9SS type A sorting domain-containing protein [Paucibacter sp. O1-1]